jgi:hypothetical protein
LLLLLNIPDLMAKDLHLFITNILLIIPCTEISVTYIVTKVVKCRQ